jgi:type I restriction enzyme S subunit
MFTSYRKFDELWLPSLPQHWDDRKLKYLFTECVEKGYQDEPLLVASQNMGVVPKNVYGNRTVEATKDLHNLKLVEVGDFVISLRSFQGGLEYAYYRGIISPAYTVIRLSESIVSGYFRYLAKSQPFIELLRMCVTGVREGQNIDSAKLKNHRIPLPPREEQDQIVRFLDWKVPLINKLISTKKKRISLLKELKQVVINCALTKGIDSKGYKDVPLRHLLTQANKRYRADLPLLSVVREKGVIMRSLDKTENHNVIPDDLSSYKAVSMGQFVINKMKAWQGSCGVSPFDGIVSPAYYVFDLKIDNPRFFNYSIRSRRFVDEFGRISKGIRVGQWDLDLQQLKYVSFSLFSREVQDQIADYLDKKSEEIEFTILKLEEQIKLFSEYRTRLISDVVTGKMDVTEYDAVVEEADTTDGDF